MEEKRTKLQVGSLLATGALFVIFLGVYLFQFTRPGAFIAGEFFPAQPAGDTVLYQGELHGVPGVLIFEPQEDGGVFLLQFGGFSEKYGFAFGEEEGPYGRPLAITVGDGALVLECFYAGPAPAGRDRRPRHRRRPHHHRGDGGREPDHPVLHPLYQPGPTGRRGQSPLPGQLAVVFLYQRAGGAAELDRGLPHGLV